MKHDQEPLGLAGTRQVGETLGDALMVILQAVPQKKLKQADVQLALMNIMSSLSILMTCEEQHLTVPLPPPSHPQSGARH